MSIASLAGFFSDFLAGGWTSLDYEYSSFMLCHAILVLVLRCTSALSKQ